MAAGLFSMLAQGATVASSQVSPRNLPSADTPKILVPTFRVSGTMADPALGVQGSDAVRNRVAHEFTARQLWAIPKAEIDRQLEAAGYRTDSALSANDVKVLAGILRADEIIAGEVTRLPDGSVKVTTRMLLARDINLAQPLGEVIAKSVSEAAKSVTRELAEARKQLRDNRDCESHVRGSKYDEAIAVANKGIAAYPKATLARLCLAQALSAKKSQSTEVIRVSDEVLAIDPISRIALGLKYAAYHELGDSVRAVQTLLAIVKTDPTNSSLVQPVVERLAVLDPKQAAPILDTLIALNPGDPLLVRTQWLVLLRANEFVRAIAAGEELAKLDSAAMDSTWFTRMTAAASAANQPQKAAEYAARAVQRFPRSAQFLVLHSQMLRRSGQRELAVAAMQRAVEIDPTVSNGYLAIVVGFSETGQPDSASAWARKAMTSGISAETIGRALLPSLTPLLAKAQASKARADWRAMLTTAQSINSVARSTTGAYYAGLAAFQVGSDALQAIQQTPGCAEIKLVEEMFTVAETEIAFGGRTDPETAGKIMNYVQSVMPQIPSLKRSHCRR